MGERSAYRTGKEKTNFYDYFEPRLSASRLSRPRANPYLKCMQNARSSPLYALGSAPLMAGPPVLDVRGSEWSTPHCQEGLSDTS